MIARLLHGFTDRLPSLRCCGKRWNDLPRHRRFAHGEEVVIPEQEDASILADADARLEGKDWRKESEPLLPCFCGAPAVSWVYDVMSDGQCIRGLAVCQKHQEEQT